MQIQTLQFLVMIRSLEDHQSWQFLDEKSLQTVYDAVFSSIDDADITQVAMGCYLNDQAFSLITLSTANRAVFNLFRERIRTYNGVPGYVLDSFSSVDYIERTQITIYVPKKYKNYDHRRLFRGLFRDYPSITAKYKMCHTIVLESTPDRPHRGGDSIMVISSDDMLEKLALFPERFQFHVNPQWRISIKGGERRAEPMSEEILARVGQNAEFSMEMAQKITGN